MHRLLLRLHLWGTHEEQIAVLPLHLLDEKKVGQEMIAQDRYDGLAHSYLILRSPKISSAKSCPSTFATVRLALPFFQVFLPLALAAS